MGWFKRLNNKLIRVNAALSFGVDGAGKEIVVGRSSDLLLDSSFTNGVLSNYGKGSVALNVAGGIHVVDFDGRWQGITASTVSPSVSPSHSASPSSSSSLSVSPSASVSPSHSASPST